MLDKISGVSPWRHRVAANVASAANNGAATAKRRVGSDNHHWRRRGHRRRRSSSVAAGAAVERSSEQQQQQPGQPPQQAAAQVAETEMMPRQRRAAEAAWTIPYRDGSLCPEQAARHGHCRRRVRMHVQGEYLESHKHLHLTSQTNEHAHRHAVPNNARSLCRTMDGIGVRTETWTSLPLTTSEAPINACSRRKPLSCASNQPL